MTRLVACYAARRGTGKSTLTANVATLLAAAGQRVAVVDADLESPSLHLLLGQPASAQGATLSGYLLGRDLILAACYALAAAPGDAGRAWLVPAAPSPAERAALLHSYDPQRLLDGLATLGQAHQLDTVVLDLQAGLQQETLLVLAAADVLALVLRPDHQDYQGTGTAVAMARELGVPRTTLVLNDVAPQFQRTTLQSEIEQRYGVAVAAVVPHTAALLAAPARGRFALAQPAAPFSAELRRLAQALA